MARKKVLFTFAFAMGLVMCVQGLKISRDKKNYYFGKHKKGDITLLKDQPATSYRHFTHHDITPTFIIKPADKAMRARLSIKDEKKEGYIPRISEIIVTDQGGGSKECHIVNGGIGKSHVTLKFKSHSLGGKLNYLVTIKGQ